MRRVARFEKVSFEQYHKDFCNAYKCDEKDEKIKESAKKIWEGIKLPKRATARSAGYDFFAPYDMKIEPGATKHFPTGIRVFMEPENVLLLFPRSSLGFKYRLQLDNSVGVIDADYYYAENSGHISAKFTNDSKAEGNVCNIKKGQAYMQGVFVEYGITIDDDTTALRTGGIGSTDNERGNK